MNEFCIKQEDETLFLRGAGRLTSQNSEEFKNTVFTLLNNKGCTTILLDLSQCEYMDSTFLGILVGFYKKMKSCGSFSIVKPSKEALGHLHSMGIDKIIDIQNNSRSFPSEMGLCGRQPTKDARAILSAHRNLMEISSQNTQKFAVLVKALESHIKQNPI